MKIKILNEYNKNIDWKTQDKSDIPDDIFDTNKTTNSYGDSILHDADYMRDEKNVVGKIEYMSPNEYIDRCAKDIFHIDRNHLIKTRRYDSENISELIDIIKNGKKKLQLPDIDYDSNGQEGLHRMIAAGDVFGFDHKFPVLIIKTADTKRKHEKEIKRYLNRAIDKATEYKYAKLEDFEEQLYDEIQSEFEYTNFKTNDFKLIDNDDYYSVSLDNVTVNIPKERVKFKSQQEIKDSHNDEYELDDIDIDSELAKILGDMKLTENLSSEQQEYFKNSKLRNSDGSLKKVYHGTNNKFTIFDISKSGNNHINASFDGIYLAYKKNMAQGYGDNILELYANITQPILEDTHTITLSQLIKIWEALNFTPEDIGNEKLDWKYVYKNSPDDEIIAYLTNRVPHKELQNLYRIIHDITGYDGCIYKDYAIAFLPEQVKLTSNKYPTTSSDITEKL